jgi:hypothetical protein
VNGDESVNFERVLQKVLWRLVTEGSISYRRMKLSFGLDDDGLEELRRELIFIKRRLTVKGTGLCIMANDQFRVKHQNAWT